MTALLDATDSQMAMLADLVESLQAAESTLSSMQAARDGLLAMAGRLAIDIAKQGDHPDKGDMTIRAIAAEIGAVQRVSDRTVERRMSDASWLVEHFPTVWEAQGAGRISAGHSRVIVDAGSHIESAADREAYAAVLLPIAEAESPNRLRPLARQVAERFQERTIDERHKDARRLRRTWATDGEDGMGAFHLHAPAALVHGMMDRLSQMAHRLHEENIRLAKEAAAAGVPFEADTRTVDQLRADLLIDLVLTGSPTGHDTVDGLLREIRANVEVAVPVLSLMGDDLCAEDAAGEAEDAAGEADADATGDADAESEDAAEPEYAAEREYAEAGEAPTDLDPEDPKPSAAEPTTAGFTEAETAAPGTAASKNSAGRHPAPPAVLDGVMPIDTETARSLAGNATGWDRVLTHPITGALLAVDRYRPSEQLRRHLRVRDQRCRFPGCRIAARKCDADHNEAASIGGATCDENLCAFCRRHHMLKHHSPWHVAQRAGGVLEWTSPTGRVYIDAPPPPNTVVFSAEESRVDDLVRSARAPF